MNLLEEYKKFKAEFLEAVKNKKPTQIANSTLAPIVDPVFLFCNLWRETYLENSSLPGIVEGVDDFIKFKSANPLVSYGKDDTGFKNPVVFPDIKHAHITRDVSIFYKLEGANPRKFLMYAVMTHKQSGTGTPQNINIQKSVSKTMKNQVFDNR